MLDWFIKYAVLLIVILCIVCMGLFEVLKELVGIIQRRYLCRIDGLFNDWLGFDRGKKYP